jgi:aspartate kinase
VPWARKIDIISYDEMLELSFWGAGVLHWRSVEVARRFGVRVHVRSSFNKEMGTIVTAREEIETAEIRGITQDMKLVRISIDKTEDAAGLAERMLGAMEGADIGVRFLSISPRQAKSGSVSVMIPSDQKALALKRISHELPGIDFRTDEDIATISIVGHGLSGKPGTARKILASLASAGILPEMVSISGITMTVGVKQADVVPAIRKLHSDLGLGEPDQTETQAGQQR